MGEDWIAHTKQYNNTYQTVSVWFRGDQTYSKLHLRTTGNNACIINLPDKTTSRTVHTAPEFVLAVFLLFLLLMLLFKFFINVIYSRSIFFCYQNIAVNICTVSSVSVSFMLKASVKDPSSLIHRVNVSGLIISMFFFKVIDSFIQ